VLEREYVGETGSGEMDAEGLGESVGVGTAATVTSWTGDGVDMASAIGRAGL
jgi:hypothetical protein